MKQYEVIYKDKSIEYFDAHGYTRHGDGVVRLLG